LAIRFWLFAFGYSLFAFGLRFAALRLCGFAALREKIYWLLAFGYSLFAIRLRFEALRLFEKKSIGF